ISGPWSGFWVIQYAWQDLAQNELAYQLVLYVNGGYQTVNLPSNATSTVLDVRAYAWIRACGNKGCSDFRNTASPAQDLLIRTTLRNGLVLYLEPPAPVGIAP